MSIFGKLFGRRSEVDEGRRMMKVLDRHHREIGSLLFSEKTNGFNEADLSRYARDVAMLLKLESTSAGSKPLVENGTCGNLRAIGYIYGAADAALQVVGKHMSDMSIGVPFTKDVFQEFSPACAERCMELLVDKIGHDSHLLEGMMKGGQEFLDFAKSGGQDRMPVGLARYLLAPNDQQV